MLSTLPPVIPLYLGVAAAVHIAATVDAGIDGLGGIAVDVATAVNCSVDVQTVQLIGVNIATAIDVEACLASLACEMYVAATIDVHADAMAGEVVCLDIATAVDVERERLGADGTSEHHIAAAIDTDGGERRAVGDDLELRVGGEVMSRAALVGYHQSAVMDGGLHLVGEILADDERHATLAVKTLGILQVTSHAEVYQAESLGIAHLNGDGLHLLLLDGSHTPVARHCRHTHE